MEPQDFRPSTPLLNVVERYLAFEEKDAPLGPATHLEGASPIHTIVVVLASAVTLDGAALSLPVVYRRIGLRYTAPTGIFGILFRPCGFNRLLGVSVPTETQLPNGADDAVGRFIQALAQQVSAAPTHTQRVAAAETLMLAELSRREPQALVIEALITFVLERHGQLNVAEMAQKSNLSRRQLERRFRDALGVPPKLFAEMTRFAYVFRLLHEQPQANWADITYACGYFDQAHFIREFRRFTGETPKAYFAQAPHSN
ncbi:helix-turn-helix domain-containing protein [Hymenobacter arizonensis]|uniref:AraC-type DNA-binding protein n=1 Tax=Hymenobacter arizonensis TaxID=1227077 RepID=A0A1I6B7A2_HYMAR|nr:helix-turn-helix domain-containing protein [Hymenobacter arizonensis]SFQ76803.1 AraC-type DNA-binding protein [Hymenobacter arizonensis]